MKILVMILANDLFWSDYAEVITLLVFKAIFHYLDLKYIRHHF